MNAADSYSPMPKKHADDDEIKRYADLLDSLSVGLLVYAPDASLCLRNRAADRLLGNSPNVWMNETGQTIAADELPQNVALRTSQPVFGCIVTFIDSETCTSWLSVNALPVASEDGSVRRVLLTLTDINEQRDLQSEIESLSTRDPLTGLFNQRHVIHLLEQEIHRARRYGTHFTLAQLDVDLFSPLCEQQGKATGNNVLAGIGKLLGESMRETDIAGRIGTDEFLLIMPNVSLKDAMVGLERLRVLIEIHEFTNAGLRVTISGGITEYTGENSAALIERSKSLLIHAREAGRNRFCLDGDLL